MSQSLFWPHYLIILVLVQEPVSQGVRPPFWVSQRISWPCHVIILVLVWEAASQRGQTAFLGGSKNLLAVLSYTGFSVRSGQSRGQTAFLGESKNLLAVLSYYTAFSVGAVSQGVKPPFWVSQSLSWPYYLIILILV